MSWVEESIRQVLPSLDDSKISKIEELVQVLGVEEKGDLAYITEEELKSILTPIQSRKLLELWKKDAKTPASTEPIKQIPLPVLKEEPKEPISYSIKWDEMPPELMNCLMNGEKPDPVLRRMFVRLVCNDLQKVCEKPGKKFLQTIADEIVRLYPLSFCDTVCGQLLGNGSFNLVRQLDARCANTLRATALPRKSWGTAKRKSFLTLNHFSDSSTLNSEESMEETPNKSAHASADCSSNDGSADTCVTTLSLPVKEIPSGTLNFCIKWDDMPMEIMSCLKKGERPDPSLRRLFVRLVCNDLQKTCKRPGRKALQTIADEVVKLYPLSFCDMICGEVLGTGSYSLARQLEVRCENTVRSIRTPTVKRSVGPSKEKKSPPLSTHGCINHSPAIRNEQQSIQFKKALQEEYMKGPMKTDFNNVLMLSLESYDIQRKEINFTTAPNLMDHILEEWPFFFHLPVYIQHTKELLGFNVLEKFKSSMAMKGPILMNCLNDSLTPMQQMSLGIEDCTFIVLLDLLFQQFKENTEALFSFEKDLTRCSKGDIPRTPFIAIVEESSSSRESSLNLFIDKTLVKSHFMNFEEAFVVAFSAYFVFNIYFAEEAEATLDFFQRCIFGINPIRGSKAARKGKKLQRTIHPKVTTFLNKLADTHWLV